MKKTERRMTPVLIILTAVMWHFGYEAFVVAIIMFFLCCITVNQ